MADIFANRIRDQLVSEKAFYKYDYGNATLDPWLTSELVRLLTKIGMNDIRDIAFYDGFYSVADRDFGVIQKPIWYFYNAETGQQIKGIGGNDELNPLVPKDVFARTSNGPYYYTFHCRFTPTGTPYFVVSVEYIQSGGSLLKDIAGAIAPILPVVMLAANIFAPGFAAILGNAIFGGFGVAVAPALASALGNIAISTVASGGDIEAAVKSAALGSLGAGIGQAVGGTIGGALDSDLLAKATTAATSAAITGGDPRLAVLQTLGPTGVKAVGDLANDLFPSTVMDTAATDPLQVDLYADNYAFQTGDYTFGQDTSGFDLSQITDQSGGASAGSWDTSGFNEIFGGSADASGIPVYTDTPNVVIADSSGAPVSTSGSGSDWASALTNLAVAAIKINNAYQSAGKPAIRVSGQTAQGTVIANTNGTLTVNGQTKLPPKGVPYLTPNGSMIVNNGDGTYTAISSAGASGTNAYPTSILTQGSLFGGVDSNMLLYGGLAIAAILLLKGR